MHSSQEPGQVCLKTNPMFRVTEKRNVTGEERPPEEGPEESLERGNTAQDKWDPDM